MASSFLGQPLAEMFNTNKQIHLEKKRVMTGYISQDYQGNKHVPQQDSKKNISKIKGHSVPGPRNSQSRGRHNRLWVLNFPNFI